MSKAFVVMMLIIAGSFVSLQASINARLAKHIGFVESAFVSFLVGTVTLFIVLLLKNGTGLKHISEVPIFYLTGGLLGAMFVYAVTYSVHIVGVTTALGITIAVQLILGLVIDRFDPMKVAKFYVGPINILGVLLLVIGVIMVGWRK